MVRILALETIGEQVISESNPELFIYVHRVLFVRLVLSTFPTDIIFFTLAHHQPKKS